MFSEQVGSLGFWVLTGVPFLIGKLGDAVPPTAEVSVGVRSDAAADNRLRKGRYVSISLAIRTVSPPPSVPTKRERTLLCSEVCSR